jgi:AcrR family transcriptional regulator
MADGRPRSSTKTPGRAGQRAGRDTKARIVQAALQTLKRDGFAGASARSIASTGGFNQALIFYHFGSVHRLLLAALDETSAQRMAEYRTATAEVQDLSDLVAIAARVYREDLESGHIKVLAEMIAGASSVPELGPLIAERIEPWVAFAQERIEAVWAGSPLAGMVSASDVAYAVVGLYLGVELLSHLEGDTSRADRLFAMSQAAASLGGLLLGGPSGTP